MKLKKLNSSVIALCSIASLSVTAHGAIVIDQNQPSNPGIFAGLETVGNIQSFQQNMANITGAGLFVTQQFGTTDDVTISLYDALPSAGGSLLTSGTATATANSWVDVSWAQQAITANQTYYLLFEGTSRALGAAGITSDAYANGIAYSNSNEFPNFDYSFRTFSSDAIPEPSSALLCGLSALCFVTRRRR